MSSGVGIVCGKCDWFNPRDGKQCASCGHDLALLPEDRSAPSDERDDVEEGNFSSLLPEQQDEDLVESRASVVEGDSWVPPTKDDGVVIIRPVNVWSEEPVEPFEGAEEREMHQARHYICKSCYSPIPGGHKFCGKCGAPTNFGDDSGTPQYYGAMQVPNKAKLILIKGEGLDGISYHLNSTEHVAGRQQGAILFPDDVWLSPRHANFFYRDHKLFVHDEDSTNGVYWKIQGPTTLTPGMMFMAGEQVFMVDSAKNPSEGPEEDGTYFYASPSKAWSFRLVQILDGGEEGMVVHDEGGAVILGQEDCDMNFANDKFLSPQHAKIEDAGGQLILTDLDSQNGTFLRIQQEQELVHGDYVFLGKQLLRVEVTP